jgi:hypothetical protein
MAMKRERAANQKTAAKRVLNAALWNTAYCRTEAGEKKAFQMRTNTYTLPAR